MKFVLNKKTDFLFSHVSDTLSTLANLPSSFMISTMASHLLKKIYSKPKYSRKFSEACFDDIQIHHY